LITSNILSFPFITEHLGGRGTKENPRMSGLFADIFHALQHTLNFTYNLTQPDDGEFGAVINEELGIWSGFVGQLQRGEIDIGNICIQYIK